MKLRRSRSGTSSVTTTADIYYASDVHGSDPDVGGSVTIDSDGHVRKVEVDVHVPGTVNRFGGTSTSEYGHLLFVHYANVGFTTLRLAEDFHRDLHGNPCTSH